MKKIFRILPLLVLMAAVTCAFAFKAAPVKKTTDPGWYVYKGEGDRDVPENYEFDGEFDPDAACDGNGNLCAILADGDGVTPDISVDPMTQTESTIHEVAKFPAQ